MKITKSKLFVAALAICLIATLSAGTLAWFSDSDSVDNKFYVATTADKTGDDIFSVTLTESEGPEYKDILPGDVLTKDPTITNTGYYDQYIRVTVTITNATNFITHIANGDSTFRADVFGGFDSNVWVADKIDGNKNSDDTITYTFYYNGILAGEQNPTANHSVNLFENVVIPEGLEKDDAAKFNAASTGTTSFEIKIKADAVQTENVVENATKGTAAAAKEAFTKVRF